MKLETEVTAINDKKNGKSATRIYLIENVCTFTGIANKADAVMVTKQAFIMAGRALVMKKWLEKYPAPSGVTLTSWKKGAKVEEIESGMWPTADEVLATARMVAVKEKKKKAVMSAEDILRNAAAMLGMTVEQLKATSLMQASLPVAPVEEEEMEEEDEDEE